MDGTDIVGVSQALSWVEAYGTPFALLGGVVSFWVQHRRSIAQDRRALDVQKIELYQRLETAAIDVFRFEAEHAVVLEKFRDLRPDEKKFEAEFGLLQRTYGSMDAFVTDIYRRIELGKEEPGAEIEREFQAYEQERRVARKYYEQILNLFEMATRFRNKGIIEPEVFGSWTIWFYDTLCEWSFREMWWDMRLNYTPDLREVFNPFIYAFDPDEDEKTRRARFFDHVARLCHCPVIGHWLDTLRKQDQKLSKTPPGLEAQKRLVQSA